MSKKRKRNKLRRKQRYVSHIAKVSHLLFSSPYIIRRRPPEIIGDDKRRFRPFKDDETKYRDGRSVQFTLSDRRNTPYLSKGTKAKITFHSSKRVTTCIRRRARRIALFAKGHAGYGKRVSKIRLRNRDSDIKC